MAGNHQRSNHGNTPRISSSRTRPASHSSSSYGSHSNNVGNTSYTTYSRYEDQAYSRESHSAHARAEAANRKHDNKAIRIILGIIASIIYWPIAAIGVVSPFLEGFNFGALAPWQVIFSRFWLAFIMFGVMYAFAINLFHIRDRAFFQKAKAAKIIGVIIATIAISFGVIRLVCIL